MLEKQKLAVTISLFIIAFVGVNIFVFFNNITDSGLIGSAPITGFATFECKNMAGGVQCNGMTYNQKLEDEDCLPGEVVACTNICQLDRMVGGDDRVCPSYCTDYCVPQSVANALRK